MRLVICILDRPLVTLKSEGTVEHGETLTMTCTVTAAKPDTELIFHWQTNGGSLPFLTTDILILHLDYREHDGNYSCAAENIPGVGDMSQPIDVVVTCKHYISITSFP